MREAVEVLRAFGFHSIPDPVVPLGNAGGMSGAAIWRVGPADESQCLRRWPLAHPPLGKLHWIHRQMQRARSAGCLFVPQLFRAIDGSTIVERGGQLWELSSWQPGRADYHERPSAARLTAALQALANVHRALSDPNNDSVGSSPGLMARQQQLESLDPTALAILGHQIDQRHGPELAEMARAILMALPAGLERGRTLCRATYDLAVPLQPCLRDVWHDHLLFTGDQLSGLVDYGAMRVDTPVTDIARLLGSLARNQRDVWQQGLQAYQDVCRLSGNELRMLAAFDAANILLSGLNWIRWLYVDARQFAALDSVRARMREIVQRVHQFGRLAWPFSDQLC